MIERSIVKFTFEEKKRTGVVLRVFEGELAAVIYCTGTSRELPCVQVEPNTRDGKVLGLYKTSYFYAANIRIIKRKALELQGRNCSPELFLRLMGLFEKQQ